MATTIKLKNSVTTTAAPSTLVQGEVATNITDKKVWVGDATSTPVQILGAGATVAGTTGTFTGNVSVAGTFAANGGATLGDASGDALTINSSAVSIPNGLNFDSNTLVIDATNNRVGVGTASPASNLEVAGETRLTRSGTPTQYVSYTGDSTGNRLTGVSASGNAKEFIISADTNSDLLRLKTVAAMPIVFMTTDTERMRITSAGNVGIGTSSPSTKLTVYAGADGDVGFFRGGSTRQVQVGTSSTAGYINVDNTSGGLEFRINTSAKATLDSSGNLGLGVTPSAWTSYKALQVNEASLAATTSSNTVLSSNAYYDGSWKYIYSNYASRYLMLSGVHSWHTAPSGTAGNAITFTQAMTLDASGNLGIGITNPSAGRIVARTASTTGKAFIADNTANTGFVVDFVPSLTSIGNDFNQPLAFLTNNTERMRIDSSGNLLVGTTSNQCGGTAAKAHFDVTSSSSVGVGITGNATVTQVMRFAYGTTAVGSIVVGASSTSYNTSSDYRLKENIAPMTGALATVAQLKPVTYKWKADGSAGQGFIAHELQEVVPDCVTGEKDAVDEEGNPKYQGIDTSFLVATLTAAIQEQQAIINDLKARIETLESK
jgi:hypothetical protein